MSFDRGRAEALYNALHQGVANDDIDPELLLDALDQLQWAWERVYKLEQLVRDLENACHRVGVI